MASQASLQACSFFLARLTDEVSRLETVVYPGHHHGPKKWLRFISGVLDTAEIYLERALADPSAASAAKALNDAEDLANNAYELLKNLSGADSRDIPHQVVAPFQRWATALGISNSLFFRAEHQPNYELRWWELSSWATNLDDSALTLDVAAKNINWPFRRLTIPSHAMGMLPHFAVVAHELGHAIQDQIALDLNQHQAAWTDTINRIAARLTTVGVTMGAEHNVIVGEVIRSWINELKADAVGLLVAGPSFFFAFSAFLELSGRQYGIGKSHPPSDLRRHHLFQRLEDGQPSFINVMQTDCGLTVAEDLNSPNIPACPPSGTLFLEIKNTLGDVDAAIVVELVDFARVIAPTIFSAARDHLTANSADLIYKPADLRKDISDFVMPLCALIPPIERRSILGVVEPATFTSILNVGWVTLLAKLDEIPVPATIAENVIAKKMERLHELLLKAVELSEARRVWEECA